MTEKIRITCVISSLAGGGAERCMVDLVTNLHDRNYEVTLMTLWPAIPDAYELPAYIPRIYPEPLAFSEEPWYQEIIRTRSFKGMKMRWDRRLKMVSVLRTRLLETRPDVVISFMDVTNVLVIRALFFSKIPIIIAEHTDPRQHPLSLWWKMWRNLTYPFSTRIVMLTEETRDWAKKQWPFSHPVALPNPILPPKPPLPNKPEYYQKNKNIVALGRLAKVKRFDFLIAAFARVSDRFPDWQLTIFGEGELRSELAAQIKELNLEEQVHLPGRIPEPTRIMAHADFLVLSSYYEGFPNALLEGMSCGLPVVSVDCPSGPRAIIRDGVDGILVPFNDIQALSDAMSDLMENETKRKHFAQNAPDVLDRFSVERIMGIWDDMIQEILRENAGKIKN
jgi:GalNAc-alpha-(1->4)-GalNAc-alpha-(1->3)-diNAcBac-PP-undecaprenol alpha-1,4-N-acetyl-D-galactosaminyltransferase